MRLSHVAIENFKGISKTQLIDFKPITLLFGPNSAGKSTILQALHYLREILERANVDPDQTIAGGLIDLGGFATLVHDHDLARPIRLRVTIDMTEEQGIEQLALNSGDNLADADFQELRVRYLVGENTELKEYAVVQAVGLSLEVRWSDLIRGPYVAALSIAIDGHWVASIISPPQAGRARLTNFNFGHPLLQRIIDPDEQLDPEGDAVSSTSPLEDEVAELAREVALDRTTADTPDDILRIAVQTDVGALPDIDQPLSLDLLEVDEEEMQRDYIKEPAQPPMQTGRMSRAINAERARRRGVTRLLDELILGPVRIVRDYLGMMTYIGPLREIPSRSYRPRLSPDDARWAQGLGAWDLLYSDTSGKLLDDVNAWLAGEEKLRTGYRLEKTEFKEIPIPSRFHQLLDRGLNDDDVGELQELYNSLLTRSEIALRDFSKGIIVAPTDVGVGISQMVPVIVGCLRARAGIVAIEQPELHVHPAIQVGLGDLLIRAIQPDVGRAYSGKSLLIETHSEHLMLRLLRRIREKSENELPPGALGLEPSDLSVIYVESSEDGVQFRPLRVDKEGEFLDRWPKGFFEERAKELF